MTALVLDRLKHELLAGMSQVVHRCGTAKKTSFLDVHHLWVVHFQCPLVLSHHMPAGMFCPAAFAP